MPHLSHTTRRHITGTLITIMSVCFMVFGFLLPLTYRMAPLALHKHAAQQWLHGAQFTPFVLNLMLSILGGSIVGKWLIHAWIAHGPLRQGKQWARNATLAGLLSWFVMDSLTCLALGATFNIWMINLLPLCSVGLVLVWGWRACAIPTDPPKQTPARRATIIVLAMSIMSGVMICLDPWIGIFGPWFASMEGFLQGPLQPIHKHMAWLFFGPVGGCVAAQFLMMWYVARHVPSAQHPWRIITMSLLGWFVVDSTWGIIHGAWFNILLINIPTLITQLPLLIWWRHEHNTTWQADPAQNT